MQLDRFTIKSQEALSAAQARAQELNHQQVEPVHVLDALIGQTDGVVLPGSRRQGRFGGRPLC